MAILNIEVAQGYPKGDGNSPTPYRGYYFRILTSQGKDAPGGAKSYIANGKMTEGFAVIPYPAEYRSSGVMTFIISQDGVVYQKILARRPKFWPKQQRNTTPIPPGKSSKRNRKKRRRGKTAIKRAASTRV